MIDFIEEFWSGQEDLNLQKRENSSIYSIYTVVFAVYSRYLPLWLSAFALKVAPELYKGRQQKTTPTPTGQGISLTDL